MPKKYEFTAIIERTENGGAYVTIPFDVEKEFGKKRVKVNASLAGVPYRGSLLRMGTESHILIVLKEIREKLGVTYGDTLEVVVEEDLEPRVVTIPDDVSQVMSDYPQAQAFFDQLSYSDRRQYMLWIESAKREETRQSRILKMIELLEEGKKTR